MLARLAYILYNLLMIFTFGSPAVDMKDQGCASDVSPARSAFGVQRSAFKRFVS